MKALMSLTDLHVLRPEYGREPLGCYILSRQVARPGAHLYTEPGLLGGALAGHHTPQEHAQMLLGVYAGMWDKNVLLTFITKGLWTSQPEWTEIRSQRISCKTEMTPCTFHPVSTEL